MDNEMPVMDGYEATKKIRELEKDKGVHKTLIVGIVSNIDNIDRKKFEDCGFDEIEEKPLN